MKTADLQFIAPLTVGLVIDGTSVTVTPIVLRQLPKVLLLVQPIFKDLLLQDDDLLGRFQLGRPLPEDLEMLMQLFIDHGERVVEFLAECTGQTPDFVGGLLPDRAVALMAAAIEVNVDFFVRAMPNFRGSTSRAVSAMPTPERESPASPASPSATPTPSTS